MKLEGMMQQRQFEQIVELTSKEETAENVSKLMVLLRNFGAENIRETVAPLMSGGNDLGNMAGFVLMNPVVKPKFLNCVLAVAPEALLQEFRFPYPQKYRTPLHIAIRSRNFEKVTTVLTHSIFVAARSNDIEADCSRLVRSYMWALQWYYETRDVEKILALQPVPNISEQALRQKAAAFLMSQGEISAFLLENCKASMREACRQGKKELPLEITQMCVVDGIIGEGYWQHTHGFELLGTQKEKLSEICDAFFPEVELRQPAEERPSILSYVGAPLVIGVSAILLWQYATKDAEQGCVIS